MRNALLQTANTAATTVSASTAGAAIAVGSPVRRRGWQVTSDGSSIMFYSTGYYAVDVNVTVAPTTAVSSEVQLYLNGVAVPGAVASTPASIATCTLSIPTTIRVCDCSAAVLTIKVAGGEATVSNVSVRVVQE
ncbi:hypothetical protein [Paratractidigestivibacter sp.]|uniref:hypothetical protein n=1 Tax=Paratractidigestivibacter sp. TaxID=2847316 RepID=UPI002AC971A3|nr:hypothetical protein [Paratractidigestivibacter sp.]